MDTVLFDLDGTLVDTLDDITREANAALRQFGLPSLTRDEVRERVGEGGTALIEASVRRSGRRIDSVVVARAQETYLSGYAQRPAVAARLYPGAQQLLGRLRAAGVRTALCTNKAGPVTHRLLSALGLEPYFDAVITGDSAVGRKPAPGPLLHALDLVGGTSALMVGDSVHDLRAAQAAGMPVAWVNYGYGTPIGAGAPDLELEDLDGLETAARAAGLDLPQSQMFGHIPV
ncbi:phosphoglycolate phosphatase [Micromonospora matsumotoense]|uniref:Phosphoglycolate phosphatase n=1 Tax=Micromonospora matsumotoense TaxID=121616 RepID=A0A1C4ZQW9_9ACTN|nr:HAD-IA family hydrolase [Micromonospora matsumotoense]SCF35194.1 phosphoglycolate phosphatase [Micromonospora matsumotoense]